MTAVRLLIFALMLAGRLAAQSLAVQNMDIDKIAASSLPAAPVPMTTTAPPRTKPERVLDKKFFAVMGSLGGAESFRFASRKRACQPVHRRKGIGLIQQRIPGGIRSQEVALLATRRPHHPQTLVGLPCRHDRYSYQECGRQRAHARSRRLHLGGMRPGNANAIACVRWNARIRV